MVSPSPLVAVFPVRSRAEFLERYAPNVSKDGIFIVTREAPAIGSEVAFEVRGVDGTAIFRGLGVVRWARAHQAGTREPPGLGVHFTGLDPENRAILEGILAFQANSPAHRSEFDRLAQAAARPPAASPAAPRPGAQTRSGVTPAVTLAPPLSSQDSSLQYVQAITRSGVTPAVTPAPPFSSSDSGVRAPTQPMSRSGVTPAVTPAPPFASSDSGVRAGAPPFSSSDSGARSARSGSNPVVTAPPLSTATAAPSRSGVTPAVTAAPFSSSDSGVRSASAASRTGMPVVTAAPPMTAAARTSGTAPPHAAPPAVAVQARTGLTPTVAPAPSSAPAAAPVPAPSASIPIASASVAAAPKPVVPAGPVPAAAPPPRSSGMSPAMSAMFSSQSGLSTSGAWPRFVPPRAEAMEILQGLRPVHAKLQAESELFVRNAIPTTGWPEDVAPRFRAAVATQWRLAMAVSTRPLKALMPVDTSGLDPFFSEADEALKTLNELAESTAPGVAAACAEVRAQVARLVQELLPTSDDAAIASDVATSEATRRGQKEQQAAPGTHMVAPERPQEQGKPGRLRRLLPVVAYVLFTISVVLTLFVVVAFLIPPYVASVPALTLPAGVKVVGNPKSGQVLLLRKDAEPFTPEMLEELHKTLAGQGVRVTPLGPTQVMLSTLPR